MSINAMNWVWNHSKLKGARKLMLLAIADWCNDDGECYYGARKLTKKVGLSSHNSTSNMLRAIEKTGELTVRIHGGRETKSGNTNYYYMTEYRKTIELETPEPNRHLFKTYKGPSKKNKEVISGLPQDVTDELPHEVISGLPNTLAYTSLDTKSIAGKPQAATSSGAVSPDKYGDGLSVRVWVREWDTTDNPTCNICFGYKSELYTSDIETDFGTETLCYECKSELSKPQPPGAVSPVQLGEVIRSCYGCDNDMFVGERMYWSDDAPLEIYCSACDSYDGNIGWNVATLTADYTAPTPDAPPSIDGSNLTDKIMQDTCYHNSPGDCGFRIERDTCIGCELYENKKLAERGKLTDIEWNEPHTCAHQSCGDDTHCHYCGKDEHTCECDSSHCGYTGHDNEPLMTCNNCYGFGVCHTAEGGYCSGNHECESAKNGNSPCKSSDSCSGDCDCDGSGKCGDLLQNKQQLTTEQAKMLEALKLSDNAGLYAKYSDYVKYERDGFAYKYDTIDDGTYEWHLTDTGHAALEHHQQAIDDVEATDEQNRAEKHEADMRALDDERSEPEQSTECCEPQQTADDESILTSADVRKARTILNEQLDYTPPTMQEVDAVRAVIADRIDRLGVPDEPAPPKKAKKVTPHTAMKNALVAAMGYAEEDITCWGDYQATSKKLRAANFPTEDVPALHAFCIKLAQSGNYKFKSPMQLAKDLPEYKKHQRQIQQPQTPADEPQPLSADDVVTYEDLS